MIQSYQALMVHKKGRNQFSYAVDTTSRTFLPDEEVLIRVHYSSVNYKDIMSVQGHPAITRRFPHTPGIDAAGVVEESRSALFNTGDRVAVISYTMGMTSPGGFGQYVSVPAKWVMKLEDAVPFETAMAYGTAGYTAVCALAAAKHQQGDLQGKRVVVTGATGGVSSFAIALFKHAGCVVTAITGKETAMDYLHSIGADEVQLRTALDLEAMQNLLTPCWDIAVDVVGGELLRYILKCMHDRGTVLATGMVGGTGFEANVLPFILRGVQLVGVNTEQKSAQQRQHDWRRLQTFLPEQTVQKLYQVVPLHALPQALDAVMEGTITGRIVVDLRQNEEHK